MESYIRFHGNPGIMWVSLPINRLMTIPQYGKRFDNDTYKIEHEIFGMRMGIVMNSYSQMNIAKISQTFPNAEVIE